MLPARPLEQLTGIHGETWLDCELVSGGKTELAADGYGAEARKALALRRQWLVEQQLASADGEQVIYNRNLLRLLREHEARAVGA